MEKSRLIVHYGLPQRGVPWSGLAQGWPVLVMGLLLAGPLAQFLLSIPAAVLVVLPVFIGAVFSL